MRLDALILGSAFVEFSPVRTGVNLGRVGQFRLGTGGSATNLAVALSRLKLRVGLISCVGKDEFGKFVLQDLRKEGVNVKGVKIVKGYRTGISFYHIDGSRRKKYFFYRFGGFSDPESTLSAQDIDLNYVRSARAFVFTEASIRKLPSRDAALKAAQTAKKEHLISLYDPNFRAELWPSVDEARRISSRAIGFATVVTPNESEARMITGEKDMTRIVSALLKLGAQIAVIKRGPKGAVIGTEDGVERIPAFRVKVIDDTGAGDAFNAGLLYGLLHGWSISKCGLFANANAALKLSKLGGKDSMPHIKDVRTFLKRSRLSYPT